MSLWPPQREDQAKLDVRSGASPTGRSGRQTKSGASGSELLLVGRHVPDRVGEPSREVMHDALQLLARTDLRPETGAISQPAVVVAGERDTLVPPAAGEWLSRTLPRASFRLIPGAAHAPFLSHPDAFMSAFADAR